MGGVCPTGVGAPDGLALLTATEVANLLEVTPEAVRAAVRDGRLHAYRLGEGPKSRIRIPSASVAEYLRETKSVTVERR